MEPLYRVWGWIASACEWMSRTRGNGIGLNWWLMFVAGMCGCFAAWEVRESLVNGQTSQEVPLSQIVTGGGLEDYYIRTHGEFVLDAALQKSPKGKPDKVEKVYIPIIDVRSKSAVYVELDPETKHKPEGLDASQVTGMVRKLDSQLKEDLGKTTRRVGDITISSSWMIVAGDRPARAAIWIPVAAALWGVVLAMLTVAVQRYTVFRNMPVPVGMSKSAVPKVSEAKSESAEAGAPASAIIRVTGRFSLGPKDRQKFHNMPAVIAILEGGMLALVTQTDASVSFMGTVTQKRDGVWLIPICAGTLGPPRYGRYYFGGRGWPAFRVSYTDDLTGKTERAILAFDSLQEMRRGEEALYHPQDAPAVGT